MDSDKPLTKLAEAFNNIANSINNNSSQVVELELAPFSHACSLISPLIRSLGIVFKFVETEYVNKVNDLCEASKSISTVESMIEIDMKENCVRNMCSHTRNLLRVKRGLDAVRHFFQHILAEEDNDNSLRNAILKAYGEVFSAYHGWAIQKAVTAAVYALPTKQQMLKKLNEDGVSSRTALQNYVTASALVIVYIDKLFQSRELSLDWR